MLRPSVALLALLVACGEGTSPVRRSDVRDARPVLSVGDEATTSHSKELVDKPLPAPPPEPGGMGTDGATLRFTDVSDTAGLPAARTPESFQSGGLAAFDADGDGDLDLVVLADNDGFRYLINEGGLHFRDASSEVKGMPVRPLGLAAADCDGDGDTDLVVTGTTTLTALRNDAGTLTEIPGALQEYPDAMVPFSFSSAVFFDADGDEDLDVWVGCYDDGAEPHCPDRLFINQGDCTFRDEARERGLDNGGYSMAGAVLDIDGDGRLDLLVSNDFGMTSVPNRVFHNDGGHFTEISSQLGLNIEVYGMSALVADIDGDGVLDAYVSNFARSVLFARRGESFVQRDELLGIDGGWIFDPDQTPVTYPYFDPDGSPLERRMARFSSVYLRNRPDDPHAFAMTTWAATAADLDDDGQVELHLADGNIGILGEANHQPDRLYQRTAAGNFRDVAADAGLVSRETKRTAIWADLDGDGDLDGVVGVVLRDDVSRALDHVYRNDTRTTWHHLDVRLRGRAPNTDAIGALVQVRTGKHLQTQLRTTATSFLSANTAPLHFGVGKATSVDALKVRWPDGTTEERTSVPVDGIVELTQPPAR
jgi:hypothetical protein